MLGFESKNTVGCMKFAPNGPNQSATRKTSMAVLLTMAVMSLDSWLQVACIAVIMLLLKYIVLRGSSCWLWSLRLQFMDLTRSGVAGGGGGGAALSRLVGPSLNP